MMIACQPASEVAPYYRLARESVVIDGDLSTETFGGCEVEVTEGSEAQYHYSILELTPQTLAVVNASGNTDISAYPTLRPSGGFQGVDTVVLHRGDFKRTVSLDFSVQVGDSSRRTSGLAAGPSYMRYAFEWLAARLAGGGSMQVYSGGTRNPACWAAAEDLTGIAYSVNGAAKMCGSLITRRHLTGCRHLRLFIGAVVVFKNAAGVSFTYTVIGVSAQPSFGGDMIIYTLSADVDASIKAYPIAGRWLHVLSDEGASFTTRRQLVGLFINQNRVVSFLRWCNYGATTEYKRSGTVGGASVADLITDIAFDAGYASQVLPELEPYAAYHIGANSGDSSSAILVPVEGGLAHASNFTSAQGGPFLDEDLANALIASADANAGVSTGYTVTVAPDPLA